MVTRLHDVIGSHIDQVGPIAVGASAATAYVAAWRAPFACSVIECYVISLDAVTGDNTNTHNFNVDGFDAGTTERGNLDLATGTNLAAGTPSAFSFVDLSATAGQVLRLEAEEIGTGQAAAHTYTWVVEYLGN